MAVVSLRAHNVNGQCQLTRSLERILEEAHFSGELKLSNRKLKDFPKTATKYNLSDTVIADLSRNRFCEFPDDITSFAFLETLLLYHNTIRSIPQSIKGLNSLTYLDLRSNQLNHLPREICSLPLQVLLVANNRLVSLPDDLGRMERLTDLDASCNQLTNLPTRIGDLRSLRSLTLRNNQLIYLPREITYLLLVSLDLSCNKISSLPIELRHMTTLVYLNIENNPLTSPPASLCIRGLVHIFKSLETQATKDEKKSGGNNDGYTTLRRTPKHTNSLIDTNKSKRQNIDSGYSTSDGIDKRWSQDSKSVASSKCDSSPKIINSLGATSCNGSNSNLIYSEVNLSNTQEQEDKNFVKTNQNKISNGNHGENLSPEGTVPPNNKIDEKNKSFGNIQTYKEYKEALKQQRNQEITSVYRTKEHKRLNNSDDNKSIKNHNNDNFYNDEDDQKETDDDVPVYNRNGNYEDVLHRKPIQKVIPSRNITFNQTHIQTSGPKDVSKCVDNDVSIYIKPNSPVKCNGNVLNNIPPTPNKLSSSIKNSGLKTGQTKTNRNVTWNQDVPKDKLSFTMRREFDKQKEETELISQLRMIIESRLKMNLPEDLASALTDGVVLCHLANYVRPRSVASIHVPSPGVPKLTMARCRRNVDNFLEACRKIGVDEESICSCMDIISATDTDDVSVSNLSAVLKTIQELLNISCQDQLQQKKDQLTLATNAIRTNQLGSDDFLLNKNINRAENGCYEKISDENYIQNNIIINKEIIISNKERNELNNYKTKRSNKYVAQNTLSHIQEEMETDNSISILNCEGKLYDVIYGNNETGFKENISDYKVSVVNDLNTPTHRKGCIVPVITNINVDSKENSPNKIVNKRIEFFENQSAYEQNQLQMDIHNENKDDNTKVEEDSTILSILLSCTFIFTFLFLIIFPLPN